MSTRTITVSLFKRSYEPFIALLREGGVEFDTTAPPDRLIMNSGLTVEILKVLAPAVCTVFVVYLKALTRRKVDITTKDGAVNTFRLRV